MRRLRAARWRAQDSPVLPSPTMTASKSWPAVLMVCWYSRTACMDAWSPDLERGEAHEHEDERDDPEAHDDARLRPALELEVMMQRRHLEDALAGEAEGQHLQDHRDGLDDEHAAHDEQHQLLPHHDGDDAERGAEGKRPDVAHEHLGRVGVEPEKAEARSH